MAISRLAIWNMAVGELPEQRIDAIDEASIAAEACRDHYRPAVELLLEDHPYDFAIVRANLAQAANDRPREWDYAYQLPHDMAAPRHLLPYSAGASDAPILYSWVGALRAAETMTPLRIAGTRLYANVVAATLEYVTNAPSETLFTAKFARAVALELASRIVMPIKKDRARQGELIRLAEIARERAKADDMNRDRESVRDFVSEVQLARMGLGERSWP